MLTDLSCRLPFMFCNLWVTQKPLLGGFSGKGLCQHLLRMEELWQLSPCLLCVTSCPQSRSEFSLRLLPLHSVGPGPRKATASALLPPEDVCVPLPRVYPRFSFLDFQEKVWGLILCRIQLYSSPVLLERESPKWPFCGSFNSAGPLWWLGGVSRLISFES